MPVVRDPSFVEHLAPSFARLFLDRVERSGPREAFRYPVVATTSPGDSSGPESETWTSVTWTQTGDRVRALAAGLLALGVQPEDRVGIASGTCYEWVLADLAVMCAGGATTTVYPSTNTEDTAYILSDSACRIVFAEDGVQLAKIRERRGDLSALEAVVLFEDPDGEADGDWVLTLDALAERGEKHLADHPDAVEAAVAAIEPDQLATLIYTSGTTGRPKGVRLKHRSWVYEGEVTNQQGILGEDDLQFLWLPLAHSFGKVLLSTQLACGFATAIDGRVDRIVDNLGIVKPTFMGAAPRVFEKAYARILTMTAADGGVKEKLFTRAFAVGTEVTRRRHEGRSVPLALRVQHELFDRLVFAKVRARFGGRVRFFISGSAALNREIAEWFEAAGILILEGYGLTESSAGTFVNHVEHYKMGTVGEVMPGSEVRLGDGDEVQVRGPGVMDGYHNLPEETAKTLTDDGWLRTGDKGALDDEGFLTITGRLKDLFKTSGGKYIAPPAIEAQFKALCPYVSQFMVFGDQRNYCVALVTLDADAVPGWAAENGMGETSYAEVVRSPACRAMVQGYVDQLNARLNRWETIKKFDLLDHDLSIESGELTPSMKVKRNVVETNHKPAIDQLYAG